MSILAGVLIWGCIHDEHGGVLGQDGCGANEQLDRRCRRSARAVRDHHALQSIKKTHTHTHEQARRYPTEGGGRGWAWAGVSSCRRRAGGADGGGGGLCKVSDVTATKQDVRGKVDGHR